MRDRSGVGPLEGSTPYGVRLRNKHCASVKKTLASKQEGRLVFAPCREGARAYSCLDGRAATTDVAPQDAGSRAFRGEVA